jgi:hypothetical protein
MFQLTVSLPSGRSEKLFVPRSSAVGDLKLLAQKTFGQGFLRLVADGKLGIAELSGVFCLFSTGQSGREGEFMWRYSCIYIYIIYIYHIYGSSKSQENFGSHGIFRDCWASRWRRAMRLGNSLPPGSNQKRSFDHFCGWSLLYLVL